MIIALLLQVMVGEYKSALEVKMMASFIPVVRVLPTMTARGAMEGDIMETGIGTGTGDQGIMETGTGTGTGDQGIMETGTGTGGDLDLECQIGEICGICQAVGICLHGCGI